MALRPTGSGTLVATVILVILATVSVALRLLAKSRSSTRFRTEDVLILVALFAYYGFASTHLAAVFVAGGTMLRTEVPLDSFGQWFKCLFALEMIVANVLTPVKLSIIIWYRTIFTIPAFNLPSMIVGIACIIWYIVVTFVLLFQCNPVSGAWNPVILQTGACLKFGKIIMGYEVTNIALDIAILALPLWHIRNIQISRGRKIAVGGIFLLGAFVLVTCCVRLTYLYFPNELRRIDQYRGLVWSSAQLSIAIVCANLPLLRPVFPREITSPLRSRYWSSSRTGSGRDSNSNGRRQYNSTVNNKIPQDSESAKHLRGQNGYSSEGISMDSLRATQHEAV